MEVHFVNPANHLVGCETTIFLFNMCLHLKELGVSVERKRYWHRTSLTIQCDSRFIASQARQSDRILLIGFVPLFFLEYILSEPGQICDIFEPTDDLGAVLLRRIF